MAMEIGTEAFLAVEPLEVNLSKAAWIPEVENSSEPYADAFFNLESHLQSGHIHGATSASWHGRSIARSLASLTDSAIFWSLTKLGLDVRPESISRITKDLWLVASPAPVLLAVITYVAIVVLSSRAMKRSGVKQMTVEPKILKAFVLAHNLFLCLLSLFMGVGIVHQAWAHGYKLWGNSYSNTQVAMGRLIYIFYVSKLYEFVDTFIMLWKRSLRQVTVLHVYHHATISVIWWILSYRAPGGDAYFSAAMNSWVHVFMYAYYFMAAVIGKNEKRRKKYLFWGKYLTMVQMVQFGLFMAQAAYMLAFPQHCFYPRPLVWMLFLYSLSLLLFFANFFLQKHVLGSGRKKAAKVVDSTRLAPEGHVKEE